MILTLACLAALAARDDVRVEVYPPSVSLEEGNAYANRMRRLIKSYPEVEFRSYWDIDNLDRDPVPPGATRTDTNRRIRRVP